MGRLKQICLAIYLIANLAAAQNSIPEGNAGSGESLFIHANTTVLLAGETLYCKFYCLNPSDRTAGSISKIAYVELIGSDLKSVFKHKVYLDNGIAQGDFFLPSTVPTGNYKLVTYTKWMLDHSPADFFQMDVTVINPFRAYAGKTGNVASETAVANMGNDNTFILQTEKNMYSPREKVSLKISSTHEMAKGHYSLSVRKTDALPAIIPLHANQYSTAQWKIESFPAAASSLPELRGEMISGTVVAKNGKKNPGDRAVALSASGEAFIFKIVQTDHSGRFQFILDKYPDNDQFVIQVMENDRQDYSIQLDQSKAPDVSGLKFAPEITITEDLRNALQERSVASQIENAYYDRKKDSILPSVKPEPFYHPLEKQYVLDDYTRFPTVKETITEVVSEVYFKKNHDSYSLHLRNMIMDAEIYGLPLILADGLLIQEPNELFEYGAKNIDKVSLINEPYIYGPKTFSGLISFTTKSHDFQSKLGGDYIQKIEIERPLPNKSYFSPDYNTGKSDKRIPDYRYQLLWLPETTLEKKENEITFFTSDVSGKFEVVLEGFTENGIPVSATKTFEVK